MNDADKKKIILGGGIAGVGIVGLILARRHAGGGGGGVCTPGDAKCVGTDLYTCNGNGQWELTQKNSSECTAPPEPTDKIAVDGYELWLIRTSLSADNTLPIGGILTVYFKLMSPSDPTSEIWFDTPIAVTLTVTRPDGSTNSHTRLCPSTSPDGTYNSSSAPCMMPGTYHADFGGILFDFTVAPLSGNIFTPEPIQLIYDAALYCQAVINAHGRVLSGPELNNLLTILNRDVDIDLTDIDLQISNFFGPNAYQGIYSITVGGTVKNGTTSHHDHGLNQAHIALTLKLIPSELYAAGYLAAGDFTYSIRHPVYWTYPDPSYMTLASPYSGVSRLYNVGDPYYIYNLELPTGTPSPFTRIATYGWARSGSLYDRSALDPAYVQELLVPGARYELVITSAVGLEPYLSGYKVAGYPLKFWHVGYVIIA